MKPTAILCTILLSFNLLAQKAPIKFGKISHEELMMAEYEPDKSASAIILADYGESVITFNQGIGFEIKFERIRRIKILNKEGYEWGNFEIPLYHKDNSRERLTSLKAVTVNMENGKAIESKLSKDGIFEEKVSENWDKIKFSLPNIKEGSVLDITYGISSPFVFNFQDWEFQTTIPIQWSEYIAKIPEYFIYQKYSQGYVPLKINESTTERRTITLTSKQRSSSFGLGSPSGPSSATTKFTSQNIEYTENDFRWVAENVPAFIEEPHMTTYRDYISKINFELAEIRMPNQPVELVMGTWENINKELLEASEFGIVVKRSNFLKDIVEESIKGNSTDDEKVASIYNFVKSNVQWDGNYRKYTDGNFRRVLDEKRGNSAEINLMLVSMLQKAGLKADPVVISTRDHGFVRQQFPLSSQFNYVICAVEVNGQLHLLDATDKSLPISLLPERCLNGKGLVVSENNSGWIDLKPKIKTKTVVEANVEFSNDGSIRGQIQVTKEGYDGQRMRKELISKGEETYIKSLAEKNSWIIQNSKFENIKNLDEPVHEIYDLTFTEADLTADIIYLNPMLGNAIGENPFKSEKREYPVDFGSPFDQTNVIKIKIPEGYVVEDTPQPMAIALPERGGRFFYNINNMDGVLSLTTMLTISKGIYSQLEYQNLKEFFAQAISKQEEQIVLKKSNP